MSRNVKSIIIFLIPPENIVNGGIMSIFSLCKESRALSHVHHSEVILSTYIGYPSYHKNILFDNGEYIYSFDEIIKKYQHIKKMQIHVPELAVGKLARGLEKYIDYISRIDELHINIMNQNTLYMPEHDDIFKLYKYTDTVTETTAHVRYSTQLHSDSHALPLKHLSVFIDKGQYNRTSFSDKLDQIAYSPDEHPMKSKIIKKLKKKFPQYRFIEIKDIPYNEYKKICSTSKFVISFGEGFDGYFIESAFSGSIPLAVYNDSFFPTKIFSKLETVYDSYDDMLKKIDLDIVKLNQKSKYNILNDDIFNMLTGYYDFHIYQKKLKQFYEGKYDFIPSSESVKINILKQYKKMVKEFGENVDEKENKIKSLLTEIERIKYLNSQNEDRIKKIVNSKSWKLTQPLRELMKYSSKMLK